jgi:hypothetical protein
MVFIVPEEKRERDELQHQEKKEVGILSDEEKNIAHSWVMFLKFEGKTSYLITNGYRS